MSNVNKIPTVGFGTWKISKDVCCEVVYNAIKNGYRHIDCASDYGNELEVGFGIKKALDENICVREDLWITSKLWNTDHKKENVLPGFNKSLKDLGLKYLDLYLIHFPIALKHVPVDKKYPAEWVYESEKMEFEKVPLFETWKGMEDLVEKKLTRFIGICNYSSVLLHDLMNYCKIKPKVLQIEAHPFLTQNNLIRTAKNYGLDVTAFSPLGALSYLELGMATKNESLLENKDIIKISSKYNKTSAQVLLCWGIQRGCSLITKTLNENRMVENLNISNFSLLDDEIALISSLNINKRFNDPANFCEKAFNTFYSIYD
jgi:D-xylose reductase